MPKIKTHKGIAKVLKVRPGGTIKIGNQVRDIIVVRKRRL